MPDLDVDREAVVAVLNRILEHELAGAVRYTHYSLMVYSPHRIPIVQWLRGEASIAMAHAHRAGEMVTHLGAHPSLSIGALLETHKHEIEAILRESLAMELDGLRLYKKLHELVKGRSILLEEYARTLIVEEEMHVGEVDKMLRQPGEVGQSDAVLAAFMH